MVCTTSQISLTERNDFMRGNYKNLDELPVTLNATDVANTLGISRANAYILMNSKEFPTLHIGKRLIVSKDKLIKWIDTNSQNPNRNI